MITLEQLEGLEPGVLVGYTRPFEEDKTLYYDVAIVVANLTNEILLLWTGPGNIEFHECMKIAVFWQKMTVL